MAQWMNLQRIEKFKNLMQLWRPAPGLTAGRQADKIWARLDTLKACCRSKYWFSALFN